MSSLNKSKVKRALKKKLTCEIENTHHQYFNIIIDGKFVTHTWISHGSKPKDLDDYLLRKMAHQLGVSKSEFIEFCRCTIEGEDFEKLILKGCQ